MSLKSPIPITVRVGGLEYIEPLANVMAAAFVNDALNRYIHLTTDNLPNDTVISHEQRVQMFLPRLRARAAAGPHFVEAGNWAAAAVWFPPDIKLPPPDLATSPKIMVECYEKFSAVKKKHLADRQYWYLNLFGRHPERNDPGVIRAIMDAYLKKAQDDGVPAWLESSNPHARDVYIHLGFRLVDEFRLAVGKADANGNQVSGGEGLLIYAMIAEPKV